MIVSMLLNKELLSKPCTVRESVQELGHWREVRFSKDLPTGALDNALKLLKEYNDLLDAIYMEELAQEPANVDSVDTTIQRA